MQGVSLPSWLTDPQFIASMIAAFVAAFLGAGFGYWLTRKADLARERKEATRRAALAALSGVGFVSVTRGRLGAIPSAIKDLRDPGEQLRLLPVDGSVVYDLLKAALDLPKSTQLLFGRVIASQTMCSALFLQASNRASELRRPAGGSWLDERDWTEADASDPVFKALFENAARERKHLETVLDELGGALVPIVQKAAPE